MTSLKRSLNTCQSWELEYIDGTPNRILWPVIPFKFSTIIFIHVITLLCTSFKLYVIKYPLQVTYPFVWCIEIHVHQKLLSFAVDGCRLRFLI